MNPNEPLSPGDQATASELATNDKSADHSRRVFLFKLSLLLNGAVGAVWRCRYLAIFWDPP